MRKALSIGLVIVVFLLLVSVVAAFDVDESEAVGYPVSTQPAYYPAPPTVTPQPPIIPTAKPPKPKATPNLGPIDSTF